VPACFCESPRLLRNCNCNCDCLMLCCPLLLRRLRTRTCSQYMPNQPRQAQAEGLPHAWLPHDSDASRPPCVCAESAVRGSNMLTLRVMCRTVLAMRANPGPCMSTPFCSTLSLGKHGGVLRAPGCLELLCKRSPHPLLWMACILTLSGLRPGAESHRGSEGRGWY
jgi:hypothetical protein